MDHSESRRFCNAQMSSVSLFVQSMFRMHSRLGRDLSAFFVHIHISVCVYVCEWEFCVYWAASLKAGK